MANFKKHAKCGLWLGQIALFFIWQAAAYGQEAVGSLPQSQTSVEEQPAPESETESRAAENGPNAQTAEGGAISSGERRLHYELSALVLGLYDDNVNVGHDIRLSDYSLSIAFPIMLGFGDIEEQKHNYLRIDYQPTFAHHFDFSQYDSAQQVIRGSGQYQMRRLTLIGQFGLQMLDGSDVYVSTRNTGVGDSQINLDIARRTRYRVYSFGLEGDYDLTRKSFVSVGVSGVVNDYSSLISSEAYGGGIYLNYRYSPKLIIAVGGVGGWNFVDPPTPDETFEQANVRLTYDVTGKISLGASGGVEFRQFELSDQLRQLGIPNQGQHVSPVFEIRADYRPFDGTDLAVNAVRQTFNSAVLVGQDYATNKVTLSLQQRFLRRFLLGISVGYQMSDYFSTIAVVDATRNDNYYFVEPSVDLTITRFMSLGVVYSRRQNDSSVDSFSFYDNQIGVRFSLKF